MNLLYMTVLDKTASENEAASFPDLDLPQNIPVYEITNILNYVVANGFAALDKFRCEVESKIVDVCKIPNLFPPMSQFWMEFHDKQFEVRSGVLWNASETERGWTFSSTCFESLPDGGASMHPVHILFDVDKNGNMTGDGIRAEFVSEVSNEMMNKVVVTDERIVVVNLVALSFLNLHPKSVQVANNAPTRQMKRAAQRAQKKPPPTFKIILVRGMVASKNSGSGRGKGEAAYALHIVRGHMIRGTAEHPLFGKPWGVGTFWVAAYTRGKQEHGDTRGIPYKVKMQEDTAPPIPSE